MPETAKTPGAPGNLPARRLFRCRGVNPCGRGHCARCNPDIARAVVACDECGAPEYLFYATDRKGWEWCEKCGAHFCPACTPILLTERGRKLCSLCRED